MVANNQIFISYADPDQEFARELGKKLSTYGLTVWSADVELATGENWALEIGKALDKSDAMVVVLSPDTLNSRVMNSEIDYALTNERFAGRIFPVVVRRTPKKNIPWIFEQMNLLHTNDPGKVGREVLKALNNNHGEKAK